MEHGSPRGGGEWELTSSESMVLQSSLQVVAGRELTSSESMVLQVPFRWWRCGTLPHQRAWFSKFPSGGGRNLPHQRAWFSKFPSGGGGKERTPSESMVLQVPFRWWSEGTYLIREHGSPGSLQMVESGNLPHQRAWFSRFPSGGGEWELTSSQSMVLQVPFRWWRVGTYLIREHGSPGSLQVVEGGNLPHQGAWFSKFPSGGESGNLPHQGAWFSKFPSGGGSGIREHGSPGSLQVVESGNLPHQRAWFSRFPSGGSGIREHGSPSSLRWWREELTSPGSMVIQVPFRWWRVGTYLIREHGSPSSLQVVESGNLLIREHGSPGSLQVVEGGNLPHQRAWFSRFPSGGGERKLTSSESMVLQVPFR